jgi:hypothetical protein
MTLGGGEAIFDPGSPHDLVAGGHSENGMGNGPEDGPNDRLGRAGKVVIFPV